MLSIIIKMDSGSEIKTFLSSIDLFRALPPKELQKIASASQIKTFRKGETIYNEGEHAEGVWVLYKGRVQILKATTEGKSFALESITPKNIFGTFCRLGAHGTSYPCTAIAAEATSALLILERNFLDCYTENGGFVRDLFSICSERLNDVQGLRCLGQETVSVRIAVTLTRLYKIHGPTIPFTKKELSELVGSTLETTFRVLKEFQAKGAISSSRGKIHILDPRSLAFFSRNNK